MYIFLNYTLIFVECPDHDLKIFLKKYEGNARKNKCWEFLTKKQFAFHICPRL